MSNSKVSPDVLKACSQQGPPIFPLDFKPSFIKILHNLTKVEDYANPGTYIDPYTVANQNGYNGVSAAPDCSPYNVGGTACPDSADPCYVCGDFGVTNKNLPCFPLDPSHYQPCGAGTSSLAIGSFHNCYGTTNQTKSTVDCKNVGYKNVFSSKNWHGRFSYTSRTLGFNSDYFDWCCECGYHGLDEKPDTTRYLSLSSSAEQNITTNLYNCTDTVVGTYCCPIVGPDQPVGPDCSEPGDGTICCPNTCTTCELDHTFTADASAKAGTHVDKFGNVFADQCFSSSTNNLSDPTLNASFNDGFSTEIFNALTVANNDVTVLGTEICDEVTFAGMAYGNPAIINRTGPSAFHLEWHTSLVCIDVCGNIISVTDEPAIKMDFDLSAGTLDLYTFGPDRATLRSHCLSEGYCPGWKQLSHEHWSYDSTIFDYSLDATGVGSISVDSTFHREIHGSLHDPYTAQQQRSDAEFLLGQFPMSDDDIYPWRSVKDGVGGVTGGPYLTYDEGPAVAPTVPTCVSNNIYTGVVRGAPAPVGIDRVWDPYHANFCICNDIVLSDCFGTPIFYAKDFGAWSTDIGVPCATQWLNQEQASNVPQGAFIQANQFSTIPASCGGTSNKISDATLWMAKWAVLIFPKQRYNLARPCGFDRFQVSSSAGQNGHCISSISGDTLNLEPSDVPSDINPNDRVWVTGTNTLDGAWKAQSVGGGYAITLQEPRIISASIVPRQPVPKFDTGMVCKLRWQDLEPPGVCGRVDVISSTNTAPVTLSLADPTYLATGDKVEIVNATGSNINGEWTVTVSSSTQVFLNGSNATLSTAYTGGGQLFVSGAVDWKWNSTQGVGQFVRREWLFNYRDIGEYYTLAAQSASLNFQVQCADLISPCPNPAIGSKPRQYQLPCGYDENISFVTCSTHCVKENCCKGSAAYFGPTTESFGSRGVYLGWASASVLTDSQYGTSWQGIVQRSISDPLFQPQPCPCEFVEGLNVYACDFEWFQDDYSCEPDGLDVDTGFQEKFYAAPDQFESFCRVTDLALDAPPIPNAISVDCARVSEFTSSVDCPVNLCFPPMTDAFSIYDSPSEGCGQVSSFPYEVSFVDWLNSSGCICLNGQFQSIYLANGVVCFNDIFILLP